MFGIGGFELFIILLFGFLIFGPEKLPDIAKTVGKGIARFRQAQEEMNGVIKSTDLYDPNSDEPFKDPMEALDKLAKHQEEKRAAQKDESSGSKSGEQKKGEPEKPASSAGKSTNTGNVKVSGGLGSFTTKSADDSDAESAPKQESFTERKARYERERAERKAAEQQAKDAAASPSAKSASAKSESTASADAASKDAGTPSANSATAGSAAGSSAAADSAAPEGASEGGDA